jgi:hypothetical protein
MRTLIQQELRLVSGAELQCTPENPTGADSISTPRGVSGQDITPYYEAVVAATSQLIEKIVNALK